MQTGKARWTDYNIAYHFIWIPKYRCRILTGEVQAETKRLIAGCCERHGITRFRKGDALCFLQKDRMGTPVHVVWGYSKRS